MRRDGPGYSLPPMPRREQQSDRIRLHLVRAFRERELSYLFRDELQDLLDAKAKEGLSFSIVDHLRWDLRQIFVVATAEGFLDRNPALLLFTAKDTVRPTNES